MSLSARVIREGDRFRVYCPNCGRARVTGLASMTPDFKWECFCNATLDLGGCRDIIRPTSREDRVAEVKNGIADELALRKQGLTVKPSSVVMLDGHVVAANSCPECKGTGICPKCNGSGREHVSGQSSECFGCFGSTRCNNCRDMFDLVENYRALVSQRRLAEAEAMLLREMNAVNEQGNKCLSTDTAIGTGGGALLGTLLLPGVGTIIGAIGGSLFGKETGSAAAQYHKAWRHADIYFALGALYFGQQRVNESRHCFVQALALVPDHQLAKRAIDKLEGRT